MLRCDIHWQHKEALCTRNRTTQEVEGTIKYQFSFINSDKDLKTIAS
jgi:hypothetical protein